MADQSRDALDRFWDDLVRGQPAPRVGLDQRLGDAVRGLHAAQDIEGPSPTFVARLQEELMLTDTATLPRQLVAVPHVVPNGRVAPSSRSPRPVRPMPPRRPGWTASLSLAVVVVLALGIGYRALTGYDDSGSGLGGIPAVVVRDGKPLPNGVTDVESLVEIVLPDGLIAAGARTDLALLLHEFPSGTTRNEGIDPTGCCPGLNIVYILTGTASVRADGPMQLLPKVGSLEPVAITAGTDVVLAPGDTLLYRQEVTWEWTVSAGDPMEVLLSVALGGIYGSFWNTFSGHPVDSRVEASLSFATSDYPIRLWRATLAPEATLQPSAGVIQLAVSPVVEGARIADLSGYAVRNRADEPVTLYLMSVGMPDTVASADVSGDTPPAIATEPRTAAAGTPPSPSVDGRAASGAVGDDTLAEVTMPVGMIPAGEPTDFGLMLYTLPGGTTTRPANTAFNGCCPGLNIVHVLDGTATVRGDGTMRLSPHTGDRQPEVVTAGTEVVIEPGDTLLIDEATTTDWTVADDGTTSLL